MDNSVDIKWYFHVWKNYGNFEGRASRKEYWNFFLFNFLAGLILGVVSAGVLSIIYSIAVIVPNIAVGVRRLHDIGKSGWLMLLGLIPLVGFIILIVFFCLESSSEGDKYAPYAPSFPD